MNAQRYMALAELAGAALLRRRAYSQPVDQVTGAEPSAVYIIVARTGIVLYVGSAYGRPAWRRIREHLSDPVRTRRWHETWILPLRSHVSEGDVRRIEGLVGRYLRPYETKALPAVVAVR